MGLLKLAIIVFSQNVGKDVLSRWQQPPSGMLLLGFSIQTVYTQCSVPVPGLTHQPRVTAPPGPPIKHRWPKATSLAPASVMSVTLILNIKCARNNSWHVFSTPGTCFIIASHWRIIASPGSGSDSDIIACLNHSLGKSPCYGQWFISLQAIYNNLYKREPMWDSAYSNVSRGKPRALLTKHQTPTNSAPGPGIWQ